MQYLVKVQDFLVSLRNLTTTIQKAAVEAYLERETDRKRRIEALVAEMPRGVKVEAERRGEQTRQGSKKKTKRIKEIEDFIRPYNFTDVIISFSRSFWLCPRYCIC